MANVFRSVMVMAIVALGGAPLAMAGTLVVTYEGNLQLSSGSDAPFALDGAHFRWKSQYDESLSQGFVQQTSIVGISFDVPAVSELEVSSRPVGAPNFSGDVTFVCSGALLVFNESDVSPNDQLTVTGCPNDVFFAPGLAISMNEASYRFASQWATGVIPDVPVPLPARTAWYPQDWYAHDYVDEEVARYRIVDANISTNVVPLPPAVGLFGSALGVVGWFRRKNSA